MQGEDLLKQFYEETYQKELIKISDRIYFFYSYGHSNAIAIIGDSSVILVDTLDSDEYSKDMLLDLQNITKKPVKTIIYTHSHPDHRGGAATFKETVEEIIAFTAKKEPLAYYEKIQDILNRRGTYQHGTLLTDEEAICQGIGKREGRSQGHGQYHFLAPTTLYNEECVERTIDGVRIKLVRAPGETDDQIFIWLPDDEVICTGDNYYGVFPALYAIRGTQYRDIATWIESLKNILSYPAKVLLPGHTKPLYGKDIQEHLYHFKEALEYILFETLNCMNKGMTLDETVEHVKLPENLAHLSYLQEYYGTVEWAVKSVFNGYVGWFDGNPTNLLPVHQSLYHKTLLDLIGKDQLLEKIHECMEQEEYQLALQLLELIDDKELKKECLLKRAKQVTSANARHYYIAYAKDL